VVGPATVAALPKQYQSVAGHPMVLHTLAAFAGVSRLRGTLVAVAPGDHFLDAYPSAAYFTVDCGGPTRADTVLGGLRALQARGARAQDWVLVHDAARCLVTPEQIDALIDACAHDERGRPAGPQVADTLKTPRRAGRRARGVHGGPQRQMAGADAADVPHRPLRGALEHVGSAVTDEASAMEAMGLHPRLVAGSALNFKVTYPEDFALAQAVLAQRGHGATLERFGGVRLHTDPAKEQDT
jgi:2-C-methyl-D-erythritol 4-phosphate cytidylyltransferase